jgi:pilus assembly protein Flp/PilA
MAGAGADIHKGDPAALAAAATGSRSKRQTIVNKRRRNSKMVNLYQLIENFRGQRGQGLVEYALILALISVVAIAIMTTVGQDVISVFTSVEGALP